MTSSHDGGMQEQHLLFLRPQGVGQGGVKKSNIARFLSSRKVLVRFFHIRYMTLHDGGMSEQYFVLHRPNGLGRVGLGGWDFVMHAIDWVLVDIRTISIYMSIYLNHWPTKRQNWIQLCIFCDKFKHIQVWNGLEGCKLQTYTCKQKYTQTDKQTDRHTDKPSRS